MLLHPNSQHSTVKCGLSILANIHAYTYIFKKQGARGCISSHQYLGHALGCFSHSLAPILPPRINWDEGYVNEQQQGYVFRVALA